MIFEEKFIFFPAKYPEGDWDHVDQTPAEGQTYPLVEDCWFVTSDGVRLHGWYCRPCGNDRGVANVTTNGMVLLWCHGNAGNLSHRYPQICLLVCLPLEVFIFDYRGYGRSEGQPTEQGVYLDSQAAWAYLTQQRAIPRERIVLLGKSLGGAVAIDLAQELGAQEPAGIVVESSFTSARDMAHMVMPLLPRALMRTKMDSVSKIANVRCPKLFIHSRSDEIVPYDLGMRLYEAAAGPKQFFEVDGAGHNDTWIVGGRAYFDAINSFVRQCAPAND